MQLKDLVTDFATNKMSRTKLWSNIANFVASAIVILQAYKGTLLIDIFIAYLVFVGASSLGSKFLSFKFGNKETDTKEQN